MKTETKVTHTPTPWHVLIEDGDVLVNSAQGYRIAQLIPMSNQGFPEENAAFIVRAVNAYQVYRDALESISKNGCCDKCQEAKLVALKALAEAL